MATAIVVWCIASFLIAPLIGRAISTRAEPRAPAPEPAMDPERKARKHEMQTV